MEENEKVIFVTSTTDYRGNLFLLFENGKAVKIPAESYRTKTNRRRLINAYSSKSRLIFMTFIDSDRDYVLTRDDDKACLFSTALVPVSGTKTSGGVQLYTLKKNSSILDSNQERQNQNLQCYHYTMGQYLRHKCNQKNFFDEEVATKFFK